MNRVVQSGRFEKWTVLNVKADEKNIPTQTVKMNVFWGKLDYNLEDWQNGG